jgi:ABC-type antimicrobial peptide transport system permease subunit
MATKVFLVIHRLATEQLRDNAPQTVLNAGGIAFAVMLMLTLVGTTFKPQQHSDRGTAILEVSIALMMGFALVTAILFIVINRVSQVRTRTSQFAIFRMLGASFSFITRLLLQETILVGVPGILAGIVLACLGEWLIAVALPDLFVTRTTYRFWFFAGAIPVLGFFVAGVFAAWIVTRRDVLDGLVQDD